MTGMTMQPRQIMTKKLSLKSTASGQSSGIVIVKVLWNRYSAAIVCEDRYGFEGVANFVKIRRVRPWMPSAGSDSDSDGENGDVGFQVWSSLRQGPARARNDAYFNFPQAETPIFSHWVCQKSKRRKLATNG